MKREISYKNLIVNPENYRFDPVDTQDQAIDLMLQEKGKEIFNLAKDVLERGFDKAKDFRVIRRGKDYLVLDGNRRATALKCLWDINLIKDKKLREKFEKLNIDKTKLIKVVNTFVYKTEKDAALWVKLDHTGKNNGVGKDSWGSAEVDRFGYKFEGKISPAMQAVFLVEDENNKKVDTKKLKITTINRILSNPESRSYIGVDISKGKLIFKTGKVEVVERLNKLFEKVIKDDVAVNEVYYARQSQIFVKDLFGDKPQSKDTSTLNKSDEKDSTEKITSEKQGGKNNKSVDIYATEKKSKRGENYEETIIENDEYVPKVQSEKIKELYNELKIISVKKCPTAVSALVRILTDISVKAFLDKKDYKFNKEGHLIINKDGQKNKTSLKEKINYISNTYIEDGDLRKAVVALNEDYLTQNLNEVMHNCIFTATETKIRDLWKNLKTFLEFLWKEVIILESKK